MLPHVTVGLLGRRLAVPAALPPLAVAGVAGAACLAVGLIDPTQNRFLPPCPFRAATGLDCPGCGSTRALHQLLGGHVGVAAGFNVLLLVALPYIVWSWLAWAVPAFGGPRLPALRPSARATWAVLVVIVVFAVVRNLPFDPLRALGTD